MSSGTDAHDADDLRRDAAFEPAYQHQHAVWPNV